MCLDGLRCFQNAGKLHSESTKFQIVSWGKSLMSNPGSTPVEN